MRLVQGSSSSPHVFSKLIATACFVNRRTTVDLINKDTNVHESTFIVEDCVSGSDQIIPRLICCIVQLDAQVIDGGLDLTYVGTLKIAGMQNDAALMTGLAFEGPIFHNAAPVATRILSLG